jgi:hypothetical protein
MRALFEDQKARKLSIGIEADITGTNPHLTPEGKGQWIAPTKSLGTPGSTMGRRKEI